MTNPGPPRPKGKTKEPVPEVDEETTTVQAAPAEPPELEVTIADPASDDLLKTNELPAIGSAEEPEDPNKAYLAPQVLPTPAVPDQDDAQRIVLNLPDKSAVLPPSPADVDRARRRAPTVKIPRATLAARTAAAEAKAPAANAPVEPAVALPPAPPPAPKPPAPTAPKSSSASPTTGAAASRDSKPLLSLPTEPRAEAPPTALHVSSPPPARRSRLPWVALAALCIGAGAFAMLTLKKEERRESAARETPQAAGPGATQSPGRSPAPVQPAAQPSPLAETTAAAPEPATTQAEPASSQAAASVTSLPPATAQPLAAQTTTRSPSVAQPPAPAPTPYKPPTPPTGPAAGGAKPPSKPPAKGGEYTPPTI